MHTYPTTTPSTTSPVFEYNYNKEKAKEKAKKEEERIYSFSFNFSISFAFDNSYSSVPLNLCSLLQLPLYDRRHAPRDDASSSSEFCTICRGPMSEGRPPSRSRRPPPSPRP